MKKFPLSLSAIPLCLFTFGLTMPLRGVDRTWDVNTPNIQSWQSGANWVGGVAPVVAADSAVFDQNFTNGNLSVIVDSIIAVDSVRFVAGADAFQIIVAGPGSLATPTMTISGAGVSAQNSPAQFSIAGSIVATETSHLLFTNNASASSGPAPVNYAVGGPSSSTGLRGVLQFAGNSTTGSAVINSFDSAFSGTAGALTQFSGNSNAFGSTITNHGSIFSGGQGRTQFNDNSQSDATTTIINRAAFASGALGGQLSYIGQSDAGGAVITNQGAGVSGANGGITVFQSSQNVGNPTITNESATVAGGIGGRTQISLSQTTFNPAILNKGALVAGAFSGDTRITNASVVGPASVIQNEGGGGSGALGGELELSGTSVFQGTIINFGGTVGGAEGGVTNFLNSSSVTGLVRNLASAAVPGAFAGFGTTNFLDSSTAGTADIENQGASVAGGFSEAGLTTFQENSSAAFSSIVNLGSTQVGGGGSTRFSDSSTLGGATLQNRSGLVGGLSLFSDNSQAGTGQIVNEGAAVAGNESSSTGFLGDASAAQSSINNGGGQVDGAAGGRTSFNGTSTAGEAGIFNNAGLVDGALGGTTLFRQNSVAGKAVITSVGGLLAGATGGETIFEDLSSAGEAELRNTGGLTRGATDFFESSTAGSAIIQNLLGLQVGGRTEFHDASTAGAATILNHGEFPGFNGNGSTVFSGAASTAGTASITNAGGTGVGFFGGVTEFLSTSSAANATVVNRGGAAGGGGFTIFRDSSTAANGTFTNEAGTTGGAPGSTRFLDNAGAGSATITNLGAEEAGLSGGDTLFSNFAKAEQAILIATGGSNGGFGGRITFGALSSGDSAQVQLSGNGELDLDAHNGALEIGSLSGTGGLVTLGANELTVGNLNTSTEFAGVIEGTGGLRKVGTGALNLTGINTYTGDTNIDEGAVLVNGSLASANVFVNPAGTLGGNGTLFGHVFNSGIVSPGNSVGTLNIGGNYTQGSSGTLLIEVESATSFDRLIIGGTANLDGTLRVVRLTDYQPQVGDVLRFLTASGGVSGRFGTVINPFNGLGTLVVLEVVYGGDFVQLVAVQNSFANALGITGPEDGDGDIDANRAVSVFAITPNQIATALALDSALYDPRQQEVLDFLNRQPFTSIPGLLDRIAPEELTSIYTIGFAQMDSQVLDLQQRFADIRQTAREEVRRAVVMDGSGGGKASGKVLAPAVSLPEEERAGFFITGSGDFASAGGTFNASGYDIESGSAMTGFDVRLREDLVIGISAGYARTEGDLVDGGELDADGGKAALYALYQFAGGLFFEGMVGGGYNTYDIERAALNGRARGDTEGSEFDAYIASGYDIRVGKAFTLTPVLSLLYTQVRVDGYEERGSLQPLYIESQHEDSLRSRIGLRASATYVSGPARITPYLRAEWQHEFLDDELDLTSRFANGSGESFNVHGPEVGRDSFLLSGGVTVSWETVSLYLACQADLGRDNYEQHTVLAGLRKMW